MTEKEKIIEEYIKLLQEMAITKKKLIEDLIDLIPIIIQHLILVMLYPKNKEYNHWVGEIKGNSFKYRMMKHNRKYPTYNDLKGDYLQTVNEELNDQLIADISEAFRKEDKYLKNYIPLEQINLDLMRKLIKSYFEFVCRNINPNNGLVDENKIYNKINDIVREYNKGE